MKKIKKIKGVIVIYSDGVAEVFKKDILNNLFVKMKEDEFRKVRT